MNFRKTPTMLALLAAVTAASVVQAEPAGRSRAEVQAEAIAAREAGTIRDGEASYVPSQRLYSGAERAAVQRAAIAARDAGQIVTGEASYVWPAAFGSSQVTRAQVLAEAAEARRLGLVPQGEAAPRVPTAAELEAVRQAGLRARDTLVAAPAR